MHPSLRGKLIIAFLPVAVLASAAVLLLIGRMSSVHQIAVGKRAQEIAELRILYEMRTLASELRFTRSATVSRPGLGADLRSHLAAFRALHGEQHPQETISFRRLSESFQDGALFDPTHREPVSTELARLIEVELFELAAAEEATAREMASSRRTAGWLAALTVFLSLMTTLAISVTITRPLSEILAVAERVTRGRIDERVVPRTHDEIGQLGERMNEMLDRLAGTIEARRHFIADASHELRTPLTIVRGEAEVSLRSKEPTLDEFRESLSVVLSAAKDMEVIVEDLLLLARAESGNLRVELTTLDLVTLTEEVIATFKTVAAGRGTTIELEAQPTTVLGDASRLRQVLRILMDNAVKYSPRGSRVLVRIEPAPGGGTIVVKDWGRGIAKEALPYVFERFFRASRAGAGTEPGGSGLGLPIAKAIVDAHRGRISVESRPGEGTTVKIDLAQSEAERSFRGIDPSKES
ncbi:MAG: HAMP domain-containing histidine kinase [Deltaproteobacteria bacterium]|nr:HAMP domain-containing histidine kinase [Deltaproteobacteria bacterium]